MYVIGHLLSIYIHVCIQISVNIIGTNYCEDTKEFLIRYPFEVGGVMRQNIELLGLMAQISNRLVS